MIRNYLLIAWKVLGRNKFFTFVSLFGISLTIGILLIVATLVDQVIGTHYPDLDRSQNLYASNARLEMRFGPNTLSTNTSALSFYLVNTYVKGMKTPEVVAFSSIPSSKISYQGDQKFEFQLRKTCADFWNATRFDFIEGQPYVASQVENREKVVVINQATRDSYFGKGQSAVGKTIETDNVNYRVLGVVKNVPITQLHSFGDIYAPYSTTNSGLDGRRYVGDYVAIMRAKSPEDFPLIKEELSSLIDRIDLSHVNNGDSENTLYVKAQTILELAAETFVPFATSKDPDEPVGTLLLIVVGIMLIFMLLPALNLVNLNSSRIMERASEIGIRKAFGASSFTLAVQFVVENIVLTLIGGMIGLLIAWGVLKIIQSANWIRYAELNISLTVFLIALGLCFLFGILSGVLPAWKMSRMHVVKALKGELL